MDIRLFITGLQNLLCHLSPCRCLYPFSRCELDCQRSFPFQFCRGHCNKTAFPDRIFHVCPQLPTPVHLEQCITFRVHKLSHFLPQFFYQLLIIHTFFLLSIPLPSLPLSIEWLKLRSFLTTIPVPQPTTSNPQPKPYRIFRSSTFSPVELQSRYVSIQENRAFRKASLMILTLQKPGNTPLFSLYLSFLDINTTVSTWLDRSGLMSVIDNLSRLIWHVPKYLRLFAETYLQIL